MWGKISPSIINSMLKPDCLEVGKDISNKGSRYNRTFNVEVCGGVNLVNSLASIKKNLFDEKNFSLDRLKKAIEENFGYISALETGSYSLNEQKKTQNYEAWLEIHKQCIDAPKYGNDDKYVDSIFKEWPLCTILFGNLLQSCFIAKFTTEYENSPFCYSWPGRRP